MKTQADKVIAWLLGSMCVVVAVVLSALAVKAYAHDCAEVPKWDVYAVHYKAGLDAAKHEFESRGYEISDIDKVVESINCNDGRRYIYNAYKDCHCAHWEEAGSYDATVGEQCAIYAFNGEYKGSPVQSPAGAGVCGFGRGGC